MSKSSSSLSSAPVLDPLIAPFPSPFHSEENYGVGSDPLSLVELQMQELQRMILQKKGWRSRLRDSGVLSRWKQEALDAAAASGPLLPDAPLLTPGDLQYCFEELRWLSSQPEAAERSGVDGVWQSDCLLPGPLLSRLQQQVSQLLERPVRPEDRDWHPGSAQQVWDLVHPSLYCLVAGRSRVLQHDMPPPLPRALLQQGAGEPISKSEFRRRAQLLKTGEVPNRWNKWDDLDQGSRAAAASSAPPSAEAAEQEAKEEAELASAAAAAGLISLTVELRFPLEPSDASGQRRLALCTCRLTVPWLTCALRCCAVAGRPTGLQRS